MNPKRVARSLLISLCVSALPVAEALAQSAKPDEPKCNALLTRQEVIAIVGTGFEGPSFQEPRPGFTNCDWKGPDASIQVGFSTTKAMQDDSSTAAKTFEFDLVAVEDSTKKREMLPGIGLKAARVSMSAESVLVEIQRKDGVARLTFYKIAAAKILALARAVAAP